jgi:hypothetical protein
MEAGVVGVEASGEVERWRGGEVGVWLKGQPTTAVWSVGGEAWQHVGAFTVALVYYYYMRPSVFN